MRPGWNDRRFLARGCDRDSTLIRRITAEELVIFEKSGSQCSRFKAAGQLLGLPRIHEFQKQVRNAESALFKTRYVYAQHMAYCVVCSRKLVLPDAVSIIHEKLKRASEDLRGL